jgi:PAS domain S-box-containing protein
MDRGTISLLDSNDHAGCDAHVEMMKKIGLEKDSILQTAMDAFWIMDSAGRLTDVNDAAIAMLGYTREEMIAMSIPDFTPEVTPEQVKMRIDKIQATGNDRFQSKLRCKDGTALCVEVKTIWQPALQVFFAFLHDITEIEKSKQAIIQNNKRLESLVTILQHPANSVQEFLDYALNEVIRLTDSEIGYIYFYDEDKKEFALNTWSKGVLEACSATNPGAIYQLEKTGIWGEAIRQRKSIIVNDFGAVNPLKKGYPEGHVPLTKFLTVPVFHNQRIVANVGVGNKKTDYDQTDILQLSLLMDAVWKTTAYRQSQEEFLLGKKNAEQNVRQAAENWNRTFDSMKDGIALLDTNQVILQSNKAFQQFTGGTGSNLAGTTCFQHVHGESCPIENCPFERMRRSKVRESSEMIIKGRAYETTVDPILNDQGELTGAVHVMTDISFRKKEETIRSIQYNIAHSVATVANLTELLWLVRSELNKIIDTSNFFVAFYNPENDTFHSPLWADEKDDLSEWPAKNSMSGLVVRKGQSILLKRAQINELAGRKRMNLIGTMPECWLGVPMVSNDRVIGVFVVQSYLDPNAYTSESMQIMEIITNQLSIYIEKKRSEEELIKAKNKAEESDRLKSAFLANMSHEIRTPLNGILGFMELLEEKDNTEEDQQQYFSIIHKSSDRLLQTINNIIDVSKIEAGQMPVTYVDYDITEHLTSLAGFFSPEAHRKGIEIRVKPEHPHAAGSIKTDRVKLDAIYTNLIKNAIKYTDSGLIEIGYGINDSHLKGYVKDTGIGISEERIKTVFDRFIQAHGNLARSFEGSGLGLTITKAYVEMLGGTISVQSKENRGTTFEFCIPLVPGMQ